MARRITVHIDGTLGSRVVDVDTGLPVPGVRVSSPHLRLDEASVTLTFDDDPPTEPEPIYEWRFADELLDVRRRIAPGPWETPDPADVFHELARRLREAGLVAPSEPT
jgi:hypothetical protein